MGDDFPDVIREILEEEQRGDMARRPFLKAFTLWSMAVSDDPTARDFPLDQVVTPESMGNWDLDEVAEAVGDLALYSGVNYASPSWATVIFVQDEGETRKLEHEEAVASPLCVYLKYVDEVGDWRVHALAPPDADGDDLPSNGGLVQR